MLSGSVALALRRLLEERWKDEIDTLQHLQQPGRGGGLLTSRFNFNAELATGATASPGLAFADRYIPTDAQILHDGTAAGAWVSILAAK
jgi:hypothetical protein